MAKQLSGGTDDGLLTKNNGTINVLDYLEILVVRKKLIICTSCVAFILSVIISFSLPKIYSSTAMILPPQTDQSLMGMMMGQMGGGGLANLAGDILGSGSPADMYVSILNSNTISDAIIDRFKLMDVYDEKYRLDTYMTLSKYVDIFAGKKDGIISITVQDKNPTRAAAIANAYITELEKLTVNLNIISSSQNKSFYEARLSKAKGDLATAEDALKTFQSKNKMISVPDQAAAAIGGIAQIKAQLVDQEMQLAVLRHQFTDSSTEVTRAMASIANLKAQLARLEGNGSSGAIPSVGTVPELMEHYLRLMRNFKVQEALVELLTKQYEINKISAAKDVASIQVIQKAQIPDKKSKPKRSLIIIAFTFAASFSAAIYALLQEFWSRMPAEDLERWDRIKSHLLGHR